MDSSQGLLQNPLILQKIFSKLDVATLKQVRLVCYIWMQEGSAELGKRCYIPLHRMYSNYSIAHKQKSTINPKLLNTISVQSERFCDNSGQRVNFPPNVVTQCFNLFCSQWNTAVQELRVGIDDEMQNSLHVVLNVIGFPNLKKLSLENLNGTKLYYSSNPFLSPLKNLEELKLVGCSSMDGVYDQFLNSLFQASKKLKILKLSGHYYPDLLVNSCPNLKVLKWKGILTSSQELTSKIIEMNELFRMLKDCADRLVHLTLVLRVKRPDPILDMQLQSTPTFATLKSLVLKYADFFGMVQAISPVIMPQLESVSMPNVDCDFFEKESFQNHTISSHMGVKCLELFDVNETELIEVNLKRFPNVNRLVIGVVQPLFDFDESDALDGYYLASLLRKCVAWNLTHLELQIHDKFKLTHVLEGLEPITTIRQGLKQLAIVDIWDKNCEPFVDDNLWGNYDWQQLKHVLQLSYGMERMLFKGLKMTTKTRNY